MKPPPFSPKSSASSRKAFWPDGKEKFEYPRSSSKKLAFASGFGCDLVDFLDRDYPQRNRNQRHDWEAFGRRPGHSYQAFHGDGRSRSQEDRLPGQVQFPSGRPQITLSGSRRPPERNLPCGCTAGNDYGGAEGL